jgi:hypothetical protein
MRAMRAIEYALREPLKEEFYGLSAALTVLRTLATVFAIMVCTIIGFATATSFAFGPFSIGVGALDTGVAIKGTAEAIRIKPGSSKARQRARTFDPARSEARGVTFE